MTNGALNAILNNSSILGTDNTVSKLSQTVGKEESSEGRDFSAILQDAVIQSLNNTQSLIDGAERAEIEFALGKSDNTHDLMIAQNKASLAVSYTVAVRDRFLDAYKEIMNMQI